MQPDRRVPDSEWAAVSQLLGLLRTGEQSAELAFRRITRRLKPAGAAYAQHALAAIAEDEARHDHWLVAAADEVGIIATPTSESVRRFFVRLESRDFGAHLARIATLDGCVCQILSCVLAGPSRSRIPPPLAAVLVRIRRDEAGHVRTTRSLAREFGADLTTARALELETRSAFSSVIAGYESAFDALGVDTGALARRIRRDGA